MFQCDTLLAVKGSGECSVSVMVINSCEQYIIKVISHFKCWPRMNHVDPFKYKGPNWDGALFLRFRITTLWGKFPSLDISDAYNEIRVPSDIDQNPAFPLTTNLKTYRQHIYIF